MDELTQLKSITLKDIQRAVRGWRQEEWWPDQEVLVELLESWKKSGRKFWDVETLDLGVDLRGFGIGDLGLVALVDLLETGCVSNIQDLRIALIGDVSQASIQRFVNLFQTELRNVRVLHLLTTSLEAADGSEIADGIQTYRTFWEEFGEVLSGPRGTQFSEILFSDGTSRHDHESGKVRAADILADAFSSGFLRGLRVLSLVGDRRTGDEGMISLAQAFRSGHAAQLESLILDDNWIKSAGLESLAKALGDGHLRSLRKLSVERNARPNYGDGLASFGISLQSGNASELEELYLSWNEFGVEATKSLAAALELGKCPKLVSVNLSANAIGNGGLAALAKAFMSDHLRDVAELRLSKNEMGDEGTKCLAAALELGKCPKLVSVDLSDNDLGNEGLAALAKAFMSDHLPDLAELYLFENQIGAEGTKSLAAALELGKCPKLVSLNLSENAIGYEGLAALAKAFKSGHLKYLERANLYGSWGEDRHQEHQGEDNKNSLAVLVELASAMEANSLPCLREIFLFTSRSSFLNMPVIVQDAFEASYRRNPCLIAQMKMLLGDSEEDELREHGDDSVTRIIKLRRSNEQRMDRLKALQNEEAVSGEDSKVFFCGHPKVGKTTLRVTLTTDMMTSMVNSILDLFRRRKELERTRGIEVTHLHSTGVTLALWDLAGQHEYEVLHSAFLPDLSFANGQATLFVIVCNAQKFEDAKYQLEYWMRFISSNSRKDVASDRRRRVFVVVNCFDGYRMPTSETSKLKKFVANCAEVFGKYLNVHQDPFVMDVTRRGKVELFKSTMIGEAKSVLQARSMPKICREIQNLCQNWVQVHENYPVLTWEEFRSNVVGSAVEEDRLLAAAEYLHEGGRIILFRKSKPSDPTEADLALKGDIVILAPEWFCKQVVGNLLLSEDSASQDEDMPKIFQEKQGATVPLSTLAMEKFQVPAAKRDQVVQIMTRIGVCYKLDDRPEDIFVPTLIKRVDVPGWSTSWESNVGARAWVMGFSLIVKDLRTTLLPVAVLRKVQVTLASSVSIGMKQDRNFLAGKFSMSFKWNGMSVLIEYADEQKDRIDVLVKPFVEGLATKQQVNVAQEFVNKITETANDFARGVELEKRIIQPWSVADGWKSLEDRNVEIPAGEVIGQVEANGKLGLLEWTVRGDLVTEGDVLSDQDLREFLYSISRKLKLTKGAVNCLILSNKEHMTAGPGVAASGNENSDFSPIPDNVMSGVNMSLAKFKHPDTGPSQKLSLDDKSDILRHLYGVKDTILEEQRKMEHRIREDFRMLAKDVKANIDKILDNQSSLNVQIQNLESFSVESAESSVPRFLYVTQRGKQNWWARVVENVAETLVIRFLCEKSFETGTFHEVLKQEGIKVKKLKDWAKTLLPMLVWTLKVATVAAKIAGNVFLPGLGLLFGSDEELSRILNSIIQMTPGAAESSKLLLEAIEAIVMKHSNFSGKGGSSGSSWIPGTEEEQRGHAKEAVRKLIGSLNYDKRERQVGLRRVWLDGDRGEEKHVSWICNECYDRYGQRAHDV